MNWREKHYPPTVTMRRWIWIAASLVVTTMVLWIGFSISSSSGKPSIQASGEDVAIAHMATEKDVARILPNVFSSGDQDKKKSYERPLKNTPANSVNSAYLGKVKKTGDENKGLTNYSSQNISKKQLSEDDLKAMQAPISQNQISEQNGSSASSLPAARDSTSSLNGEKIEKNVSDDQNKQSEKKAFLEESRKESMNIYLGNSLQSPLSKLEVQAGTIIPGVLITGIDSDLPGQLTGQVRENVYDSLSGRYLLIPQGSKLIGFYDSQVAYGQTRVLIAWNRIILPNGKSIDLKGMSGTDLSGAAGFEDETDNHYGKIFGSVILLSVLSAGAQLSQPQNQNTSVFSATNPSINQTIAQSLGANITNAGTALLQKNINIQPTLNIRPGYKFNITATKDVVFFEAYQEN